jgi:hypothetical protein
MSPRRKGSKRARYSKVRRTSSSKRLLKNSRTKDRSLLILECDSLTLKKQSLSMAAEIEQALGLCLPFVCRKTIQTSSTSDLLSQLADITKSYSHFDVILIIGHSNRRGLLLTTDRFEPWTSFANWLKPFRPKHLILAACEAGHPLPVAKLFEGLPTLGEIYAPPYVTTKEQAQVINALIPFVLYGREEDTEVIRFIQAVNLIVTKGWVFRWRREEFDKGGAANVERWNFYLEFMKWSLRG